MRNFTMVASVIMLACFSTSLNAEVVELGSWDTPGEAMGLAVGEELAYVADNESGLRIIDISDPEDIDEDAFLDTDGNALNVFIVGELAYVADDENGLRIIDISNPDEPEEAGFVDTEGNARSVKVVDGIAYVADFNNGVVIIDVSDLENLQIVGSFTREWSEVYDLAVSDDHVFAADGANGIMVLDVSDPAQPDSVSLFNTDGFASSIAISGETAYLADFNNGLRIIDISNPARLQEISGIDTRGSAMWVVEMDEFVYVASDEEGIVIFSVSNPQRPLEVGAFNTPDRAFGIALANDLVYVADGESGIRILRFTAPPVIVVNPEELDFGELPVGESSELVFSIGNTGDDVLEVAEITIDNDVYSHDVEEAFSIEPGEGFDVTVTFEPRESGVSEAELVVHSNDPYAGEVEVELIGIGMASRISLFPEELEFGTVMVGDTAEVILQVINLGNVMMHVSGIVIEGDVFSVDEGAGEFDVEPDFLEEVTVYFIPVEGDEMPADFQGTITISSDDPTNAESSLNMHGIGVSNAVGEYADDPIPSRFSLLSAFPNPFNAITRFTYAVPVPTDVNIAVYDVNGQLVETLVNGNLTAGYHTAEWNAKDLGAGVYFVKMETSGTISTGKVVLIR